MTEVPSEEERERRVTNFVGQEDAPEVYADAANIHASADTLTLVFGRREYGIGGQIQPAKANFVVHVSPPFGLRLAEILQRWAAVQESAFEEEPAEGSEE